MKLSILLQSQKCLTSQGLLRWPALYSTLAEQRKCVLLLLVYFLKMIDDSDKYDLVILFATILFSGISKGAVITHAALSWMILTFCPYLDFEGSSSIMMVSKGTHISGCLIPLATLYLGLEVYVMHTINSDLMFEAIHRLQVWLYC
jgi:hypothetical protein